MSQLRAAAKASGDTAVPSNLTVCTYIRRWEHGPTAPSERYKLHYCAAWGITPAQFGMPPTEHTTPSDPAGPSDPGERPPHPSGPTGPGERLPGHATLTLTINLSPGPSTDDPGSDADAGAPS
ncbi:MAG TPA: hypothetical protein VMV92_03265 [Streptosporangiaceae bacterium]|nr:hypothetical protein [Streptosporangiaceae bacterium]